VFVTKERDVSPHTKTHEAIKSAPVVQAATAHENQETGETIMLMLNKALWTSNKMDHTLVNPNQLWACGLTVQDNPFSDSPAFASKEGHEFTLPLTNKGTILGASTRTSTECEVQTCPCVALLSEREWSPQHVRFPKASRAVEE
jgi:hypothetical protein